MVDGCICTPEDSFNSFSDKVDKITAERDHYQAELNKFVKANAELAKHNADIVEENQVLTKERDLLRKVVGKRIRRLKSCNKCAIKCSFFPGSDECIALHLEKAGE